MKPIQNYETVQESTGEFLKPKAGGYICKITNAIDVPMGADGKGDYLLLEYDIASGDLRDYYKQANEKFGGRWWATFMRSYKQTALGMFKHFTNCVENSNIGYKWDWNENGLVGKFIGLVLGEEEYIKNDGSVGTRLYVKYIKTIEEIQNGDFKIPELKKVEKPSASFDDFTPITDDELPFN